jgi:hypothetical protein
MASVSLSFSYFSMGASAANFIDRMAAASFVTF